MSTAAAHAQAERPHVLLVDDYRALLKAYSRTLSEMRINLHLADGPDSALKVLSTHPVDVVVSDFRLPKTDGGVFLKQVQSQYPETVRLLITGYPDLPEVEDAIRQACIYRVLPKPFDPEVLRRTISEALAWKVWGEAEKTPVVEAERSASAELRRVDAKIDDVLFRQLFHTASDPMMLADLDGTIIEVNCAFVRCMGGSCRAALERRPTILSGWQAVWPEVRRNLLEKGQWSGEVRHASEDRFAVFSISVINDANGRPAALAAVEKDVTVYRKLELESRSVQFNVPLAIAKLAEFREADTGPHLERMRSYSWLLALELSNSSSYRHLIDNSYLEALYAASPLHDVGKVGIPDTILLKPGKLDAVEWQVMKSHPRIGAEILAIAGKGSMVRRWLEMGRVIALQHHERWDGTGYPNGLKGEEIDLSARIVGLADAYDAITSKRVYKPAFDHQEACKRVMESRGSHFDPEVVDAFMRREAAFADLVMRDDRPAAMPEPATKTPSSILRRIDSLLLSLHRADHE